MTKSNVTLGPEVWQRVLNWRLYRYTRTLLEQIFKRRFAFGDWEAMGITREEYERVRGPAELPVWPPFCELILNTAEGFQRCNKYLEQSIDRMTNNHQIDISTCHVGLTEIRGPLVYKDKYCGYFTMTGGFISHEPNETEWHAIAERVKDTDVDLDALRKAYFQITPISQELFKIMTQIINVILAETIKAAVEVEEDKKRIAELESILYGKYKFDKIIGKSPVMQDVFKLVSRIIETDNSVLIEGETGTGKELIASTIHYNSPRKDKPFTAINCGGMTETLLESELFGHIKGSFTGAIRDKKGLFEVADKGTIFLDEIAEMSPALQVKLLRVLQEGTFIPVGGTEPRKIDVRIISATNKNLKELVARGGFREDLYYRINVIKVTLPPLRERPEDIPLLIDHFLKTLPSAQEKNLPDGQAGIQGIRPEAKKILLKYHWPGNIRELQNILERAISLTGSRHITAQDLPQDLVKTGHAQLRGAAIYFGKKFEGALKEFQQEYLTHLLRQTHGNISRTAQLAGIPRATLQYQLKKLDLTPADFKG